MLDPHNLLDQVHPLLAAVIRAAAQTPQPFQVVYGLRTLAAEEEAVASGHSETLHSRHLADPNQDGKAMAVDIACLTDGAIDWTVASAVGGIYWAAAQQILAAAAVRAIKVQWGGETVGAWVDGQSSHFRDWGHFQLDPADYA